MSEYQAAIPLLVMCVIGTLILWGLYKFSRYRIGQIAADREMEAVISRAKKRIAERYSLIEENEHIDSLRQQLRQADQLLATSCVREQQLKGYLSDLGMQVDAMDACGERWKVISLALSVSLDDKLLSALTIDDDRLALVALAKRVMKPSPETALASAVRPLSDDTDWSFPVRLH